MLFATEKQRNLVKSLLDERDLTNFGRPTDEYIEGLSMKEASLLIDKLFALPRKAEDKAKVELPDVPAGHYALVEDDKTVFYKVDRPERGKWAGWTFLSRMHGENHEPIKRLGEKREIIARIAEDVTAAARRYGHHMNHCGFCRKDLTDQFSRFYGVGPVCRKQHGMPISEAAFRRVAHTTEVEDLDEWQREDARIHNKPGITEEVEDIWVHRMEEKAELQRQEREEDRRVAEYKLRRDKVLIQGYREVTPETPADLA